MKLRLKGDWVRLRLTKPEVAAFATTGGIVEEIVLGPNETDRLVYGLTRTDSDELSVKFKANRLLVSVPSAVGNAWCSGDQIGFSGDIKIGPKKWLHVLVEKDFLCLSGRSDEDPADYYEHQDARSHC